MIKLRSLDLINLTSFSFHLIKYDYGGCVCVRCARACVIEGGVGVCCVLGISDITIVEFNSSPPPDKIRFWCMCATHVNEI